MFRNSFNSLIVREREGRPGASHACSEMPEQHAGGVGTFLASILTLFPSLTPHSFHQLQLLVGGGGGEVSNESWGHEQ